MGEIRIGTSGWVYPEWRGGFYPKGLAQKEELAFLSRHVRSIEINGSFYSLRTPANYRSWSERTPDDFVFAVKGPKLVTHTKRLRDVGSALDAFFESGMRELGPKLGPILWQFPASLRFDPDVLEKFLGLLPARPMRHAVEVRHPSFRDPALFDLLRAHDVAVVIADTAGAYPYLEDMTTDFVYVRLHGDEELYISDYSDAALDRWAEKVLGWSSSHDVFVYFDNTMRGAAPANAMALSERLGLPAPSDT